MTKVIEAKEGFTFGCDPEFFIKDDKGRHVFPYMIPGSKEDPHKVDGGAVQRDGMAAEINIDPVTNFKDWDSRIEAVTQQVVDMLPKGYSIDIVPSVTFLPEIFDEAPEDAKELGCTPDYNAWDCQTNPPPNLEANPYLRCAGGHVHNGWVSGADVTDLQHVLSCCDLVKQFDWYLAAWALSVDDDKLRRTLYGKAGACRIKDYGVEYRTLSNFWIKSKELRLEVWNRTQQAIIDMPKTFFPDYVTGSHNQALRECIDQLGASPTYSALTGIYGYPLKSIDKAEALTLKTPRRKGGAW